MTTFDDVPRIERIAMIARAMGFFEHLRSYGGVWFLGSPTGLLYDPYTNASQSQDVQERLRIFTTPFASTKWKAMKEATKMNHSDGVVIYAANTIREAIADCAARWQWEKEMEGK